MADRRHAGSPSPPRADLERSPRSQTRPACRNSCVRFRAPVESLFLKASQFGGAICSDRFDIDAKGEPNPTRQQYDARLQALLADRFKLTLHRETRDLPIYALVLARTDGTLGPRLRRSNIDCAELNRTKTAIPPPAKKVTSTLPVGTERRKRAMGRCVGDVRPRRQPSIKAPAPCCGSNRPHRRV